MLPLTFANVSGPPKTRESVRQHIIIHMFHLTFNMQSHPVPQPASAYWYRIITSENGQAFVIVYVPC